MCFGAFLPARHVGRGFLRKRRMNYQLMYAGFLHALEAYATLGNLEPFADLIAELEEKQLDIYLGLIR